MLIAIQVDGLLNYLTSFGEVRALIAGRRIRRRRTSDPPMLCDSRQPTIRWRGGWPMCSSPASTFARGHFDDTVVDYGADGRGADRGIRGVVELPGPAVAGTVVLRARRCPAGAKTLAELRRSDYGRHVAVFEPQLRIADGWLAAAEGNVSAAIDLSLDAARLAKESGQQAIEMLALHDAVRFGDQICIDRLIEVARATDGQLAP